MRVFVLLPPQHGLEDWQTQARLREMPDLTPYGYHHAAGQGVALAFSSSARAGWMRRLLHSLLRVDLLHVWQQRHAIAASDIVWTHTEREHLPLLLWLLLTRRQRPLVIAQCIWLFDDWQRLSLPLRCLCTWLLRRAAAITVHCRANARQAQLCVPGLPVHVLPFGISVDVFALQARLPRPAPLPVRIFAAGNDRDRDWEIVAAALGERVDFDVMVASSHFPASCLRSNVRCLAADVQDMKQLYEWADIVVLPLRANAHASGLTVLLEAVSQGVPVVCADTGGLQEFFPEGVLWYYRTGDSNSLLQAIAQALANPEQAAARAQWAQQHLVAGGLTSCEWALRHVHLSCALLEAAPAANALPSRASVPH